MDTKTILRSTTLSIVAPDGTREDDNIIDFETANPATIVADASAELSCWIKVHLLRRRVNILMM